jgi:hypothetical protein
MPRPPASRLRRQLVPLLALAAVCLLATACGSSSSSGKLLSQRQAGQLRASLNRVEQDVASKDCTGAEQEVGALQEQIDSINRLDRNLRSSLRSSVRRLETLVSDSCVAPTPAPTETTPTTPDTGTTGATGATGEEGKKEKKPKKEKPKDVKPPGKDGQTPPGPQSEGGGAGVPGESNPNGSGN